MRHALATRRRTPFGAPRPAVGLRHLKPRAVWIVCEHLCAVAGDEYEVLKLHAAEPLPVAAGLDLDDVARTSLSSPGASCGSSRTSSPTPCPSEWKKPSRRTEPGFLESSVGSPPPRTPRPRPGGRRRLRRQGGSRNPRSRATLHRSWYLRSSSLTSPTTKARVMSVKKDDSRSRGHRSTVIGRRHGSRPRPCDGRCRSASMRDDELVAPASFAANSAATDAFSGSDVSGCPSYNTPSPSSPSREDRRDRCCRSLRRKLRPANAGDLWCAFRAPALLEELAVDGESDTAERR